MSQPEQGTEAMNLIAMLMLAADPAATPEQLPEVILLDFYASYCQPCQQMVPVLQKMEKDGFPIHKIDTTKQPDLLRQYKVERLPTLILLVKGKEAKRWIGPTSGAELRTAMNREAKRLAEARKKSQSKPEATAGLFDQIRDGLSGSTSRDIRGQSPRPSSGHQSLPAQQATVRIHLRDGRITDVGTGTIIHSGAGQSTILTCAHIFSKVSPNAEVEVEVFHGGDILKYPGKLIGGNRDADIAFVKVAANKQFPIAKLVAPETTPQPGQPVFSMGCANGADPTQMNMRVLKYNYFEGPENITCEKDPAKGRSGGGLFNSAGELIGVCSGAFRDTKEGLYTGASAVRDLANRLSLTIFETTEPEIFAEAEDSDGDEDFEKLFAEEFAEDAPEFAEVTSPQRNSGSSLEMESPFGDEFEEVTASQAVGQPTQTGFSQEIGTATSTEITVIIGSNDSPTKRVIVIPKASPWLLELLTGEKSDGAIAAAPTKRADLTSKRTLQKPARPSVSNGELRR